LWVIDFRQRIEASLWFVPTIFAVAAIALANLTIWLDVQVDAPIGVRPDLVSDPGSAATFAGAVAAATLAFVAVVFATTLVAIQLAASQYSPRTAPAGAARRDRPSAKPFGRRGQHRAGSCVRGRVLDARSRGPGLNRDLSRPRAGPFAVSLAGGSCRT
jgi:hypothetical protein